MVSYVNVCEVEPLLASNGSCELQANMTDPGDDDDLHDPGNDDDGARDRAAGGARAATGGSGTGRRVMTCCSLSPHSRVFVASAVAAVGGVLFGYDTGACA